MLDNKSLEVINRFKQALLTKLLPITADSRVLESNRGKKLDLDSETGEEGLNTKVVEYNGVNYLVTSNKQINQTTRRNKRKWHDYYKDTEEYQQDILNNNNQRALNEVPGTTTQDADGAGDAVDANIYDDDLVDRYDDEENDDDDEENDDDDEDEEDDEDEDLDPLQDLDLTEILLSLTHPSELVSHPAILRTFKLNVLSRLAAELIELIETEHETLNWFHKLLQVLNGEDWYYLLEDSLGLPAYDHGLTNDGKPSTETTTSTSVPGANNKQDGESTNEDTEEVSRRITRTSTTEDDEVTDPFFMLPETLKNYELHQTRIIEEPDPEKEDELKNVQEDLINYLQVSIQRQQEYIKNLVKLRTAIIRADRLKNTLLKWGKEMYDKKSN